MKRLSFFLLILTSVNCYAFPEMIRHGYTSCTACHVSPTGGGLLTSYGRTISSELLSRWSLPNEDQPLYGAIKVGEERDFNFNIGGDFRFLQTRTETKTFTQGRFIPMQRDLEAEVRYRRISAVASYGLVYDPKQTDEFEFRRGYLLWRATDRLAVRSGRFIPSFGIMLSDHYLNIKQGHLLGLGAERDTIEVNYTAESASAFFNLSEAPSTAKGLNREQAGAAGLNLNLGETSRIGVNYWLSSSELGRRDITGVNALLGFSKSFYMLAEADLQVEVPNGAERTKGLRHFERLGYEFTKGLHLLAQMDASQSDFKKSTTKLTSPGLGLTFYPRPHFEAQLFWTRPQFSGQPASDQAFFVFHYYL